MAFTTQKDWRRELDRREINDARAPLFLIAAAVTVVVPTADPYLAMASPVEFWSVLFFRFLLTLLAMIGGYVAWVGFVPPGWLVVFPGYRTGTGSAKAAQKNRDAKKAAGAKPPARRPRADEFEEEEEEVVPA
jgi:hypothetical protein